MWAERSSLWHLNLSHSKPVIVRLNYCLALIDVRGKKAQTVVCVSFGGEGLLWRPLVWLLTADWMCFLVDLTGRLGADIWAELQRDSPRERLQCTASERGDLRRWQGLTSSSYAKITGQHVHTGTWRQLPQTHSHFTFSLTFSLSKYI